MKMINKGYKISTNSGESGLEDNKVCKIDEDDSQGVQDFN